MDCDAPERDWRNGGGATPAPHAGTRARRPPYRLLDQRVPLPTTRAAPSPARRLVSARRADVDGRGAWHRSEATASPRRKRLLALGRSGVGDRRVGLGL